MTLTVYLRLRFTGGHNNKWASHRVNSVYSHIKRDIEAASRSLTLKERQDLRQLVEKVITRLRSQGGALSFSLPLKRLNLSPNPDASATDVENGAYTLDCSLSYTLSLGGSGQRGRD